MAQSTSEFKFPVSKGIVFPTSSRSLHSAWIVKNYTYISSHIYAQLIYDERGKNIKWQKDFKKIMQIHRGQNKYITIAFFIFSIIF